MLPCEGTYFLTADISALTNEPDDAFCERLVREAGVALSRSPFSSRAASPIIWCALRSARKARDVIEDAHRRGLKNISATGKNKRIDDIDPRTPILVGGAQFTQRTAREGALAKGLNPIAMLAKAANDALADAGVWRRCASTRFRSCASPRIRRAIRDACPSACSAIRHCRWQNTSAQIRGALLYTATGGNTPQWLVNRTAEEIARGECDVALLVGAEYIATLLRTMKKGVDLGWGELPDVDPGSDPEEIGDQRAGVSPYERATACIFR